MQRRPVRALGAPATESAFQFSPIARRRSAFQRRAAVNHQLRWPIAHDDGNLPLPKPVRSPMLASKQPGSW